MIQSLSLEEETQLGSQSVGTGGFQYYRYYTEQSPQSNVALVDDFSMAETFYLIYTNEYETRKYKIKNKTRLQRKSRLPNHFIEAIKTLEQCIPVVAFNFFY